MANHPVRMMYGEYLKNACPQKKWEIYEKRKAEMIETCVFLTPKEYEKACRELAELLGI